MKNDHMVYQPGMEVIESRMLDTVLHYRNAFNDSDYTAKEVEAALSKSILEIYDLMALLSTAATPFLEKIAQRKTLRDAISVIPSVSLPLCIWPTTAKIIVFIAALILITLSDVPNYRIRNYVENTNP